MRILILSLIALTSASAAHAADACKAARPAPAALASPLQPGLRGQRLDQLPDARSIRAVVRTVEGCQYLDVLRERVSAGNALDAGGGWAPAPEHRVVPAEKRR